MIGTNGAIAVEPVKAGRHLAQHIDVEVQAREVGRGLQPPHHTDAQIACVRQAADALRPVAKPPEDVLDLGVDAGHEAGIVHICEQRKGQVHNVSSAFTTVNQYAQAMELASLIARRGNRILQVRPFDQKSWAKDAKVAEATLSMMLRVRLDKNGAVVTPSLATVSKACAAAGVPLWAFLHSDDGVLELFLSERGAELMAIERAGGVSAAMNACMAVLDELRPQAAIEQEEGQARKRA